MSSNKRKAAQSTDANKKPKTGNSSITSFFGPPKTTVASKASGTPSTNGTTSAPEAPALKFNKEKWVAGLTEEQRELLQLEIKTLDDSWLAHLKEEVTSKEFLELKRFLAREMAGPKKIFPPQEDVYSWYVLFPFAVRLCA
jgi:uracil-DNA glycosylase